MKTACALLAVGFLATACLVGEESHTLYLEPDGGVTWMVIEKDLRSDEDDPVKRWEEEQELVRDALAGEHSWARELARLGPIEMESHFIRRQRPYALVTEARFASLETLLRNLLEEDSFVEVTSHGDRRQLLFTEDPDGDDVERLQAQSEESAARLVPSAPEEESCEEDFRLVLVEGKFTAAIGFDIEGDEDVAVLCELSAEDRAFFGGTEVYFLSWTVGG